MGEFGTQHVLVSWVPSSTVPPTPNELVRCSQLQVPHWIAFPPGTTFQRSSGTVDLWSGPDQKTLHITGDAAVMFMLHGGVGGGVG